MSVPPRERAQARDPLTELLLKARDGDQEAFATVMAQTRSRLAAHARRVLRDETLVDEALSRAFAKVWASLPRYDPTKGGAFTWLKTSVGRLAIDLARARQAQLEHEVLGFDVTGPSSTLEEGPVQMEPEDDVEPAPDDEADLPLAGELLHEALQRLEEEDRKHDPPRAFAAVLRLRYYGHHSSREIAARLSKPGARVSEANVNSMLCRARDRLAELIDPEALG